MEITPRMVNHWGDDHWDACCIGNIVICDYGFFPFAKESVLFEKRKYRARPISIRMKKEFLRLNNNFSEVLAKKFEQDNSFFAHDFRENVPEGFIRDLVSSENPIEHYENGRKKFEFSFNSNGVLNGFQKFYDYFGNLVGIEYYSQGEIDGMQCYSSFSFKVFVIVFYKKGKKEGPHIYTKGLEIYNIRFFQNGSETEKIEYKALF